MSKNRSKSSASSESSLGPARASNAESGLLDAVLTLAGDLELTDVLERIVRSARDLTGARYAALGVVGETADGVRHLARFHHVGLPSSAVRAIAHLPRGKGVLGLLLKDPRPVRLDNIHDHPAAGGFPPGHPQMKTFLGVPVRVRGEIFGNLYLTDKTTGDPARDEVAGFSDEDERLVLGLAAAAGVAIENARLFAESQLRQRWLAAAARVVPEISGDVAAAPQLIARASWEAAGCSQVGVAFPVPGVDDDAALPPGGDYPITAVAGPDGDDLLGAIVAAPARPEQSPHGNGHRLVIGCRVQDEPLGVIVLHRADLPWENDEVDVIEAFVAHVTLAVGHALDEHNRHRLAVYTDRDRIARDLHDHVIQRIFAIGLSLQSTLRRAPDPQVRDRVSAAVADLDATIAEIRTSIFSLQHSPELDSRSIRAELLAVVADAAGMLGFEPQLTFMGPIDTAIDTHLANDLLATVRESLTNVARHAQASQVSLLVSVDAAAKTLTVQVEDDGIGIADSAVPRGGLRNTAERAAAAGGYSTVARRVEPGTTFTWVIPLPV